MSSVLGIIVVFGVVILAHELGHFSVAKLSGVAVERLSIGFGPAIWSYQPGETEYRISVLPLGGYVKLAGQDPADVSASEFSGRSYRELAPRWRSAILIAGPAANVVLAVLIFWVVLAGFGLGHLLPVVGSVVEGSPASRVGLRAGDRIVAIDGRPIERWDELGDRLAGKADKRVSIAWLRQNVRHTGQVTPELSSAKDAYGEPVRHPVIGVTAAGDVSVERVSFFRALGLSLQQTFQLIKMSFVVVYRLVTGATSLSTVSGPVGIAQMSGQAARAGLHALLVLTSILSVNIGVLNLLPIPVFDGGNLMFVLVEAVRKRPVKPEVELVARQWSIAFLIVLSLVVLRNDLARLALGP